MTATIKDDLPMAVADSHSLAPFLIGTAVGGLAGAVVGTLLSAYTAQAVAALIHVAGRRSVERDRERLKFELMLQ
jgi:hypothetical protein